MKWKLKNKRGQAAIEFMVVVVVLLFFLLFFMSASFVMVISDYVEYATFMAARTLKTGSSREEIQQRNAKLVFDTYTEKIEGIARNFKLEFLRTEENNVRTEGVFVTYDMDLFYLPPVFASANAQTSRIQLSAESHLGRDPSFEECQNYFAQFIRKFGIGDALIAQQMDDNGC